MIKKIGIVRETKNEWERRAPLTPHDVAAIRKKLPVEIVIQPSDLRIFAQDEYITAGAVVSERLQDCDLILGIKEIKTDDLIPQKVCCYFSHTIKGQSYNMAMLQKLLDLECTLIDYERMINDKGQRLIYFSLHAGLAGIVETLWALGRQLDLRGLENPFIKLAQTYTYSGLSEIEAVFREIGRDISENGLPRVINPMVIGITGYGNVSQGVQQLLDLLPVETTDPADIARIAARKNAHKIYKVVFHEEHMVEPTDRNQKFNLQEYYDYPQRYRSKFAQYLPYMNVLVNASFWDTKYPRQVTRASLQDLFTKETNPRLEVIGDISCDIDGGIECTVKATDPGNPVFTYQPRSDQIQDGFTRDGIAVMAVDNLPSELPRNASIYFSNIFKDILTDLVRANYNKEFDQLELLPGLKNAIIVHKGKLTPQYLYLEKYLR